MGCGSARSSEYYTYISSDGHRWESMTGFIWVSDDGFCIDGAADDIENHIEMKSITTGVDTANLGEDNSVYTVSDISGQSVLSLEAINSAYNMLLRHICDLHDPRTYIARYYESRYYESRLEEDIKKTIT